MNHINLKKHSGKEADKSEPVSCPNAQARFVSSSTFSTAARGKCFAFSDANVASLFGANKAAWSNRMSRNEEQAEANLLSAFALTIGGAAGVALPIAFMIIWICS